MWGCDFSCFCHFLNFVFTKLPPIGGVSVAFIIIMSKYLKLSIGKVWDNDSNVIDYYFQKKESNN